MSGLGHLQVVVRVRSQGRFPVAAVVLSVLSATTGELVILVGLMGFHLRFWQAERRGLNRIRMLFWGWVRRTAS